MSVLKIYILFAVLFSGSACPADAFDVNKKLGRGINLGNALEAPEEGQWGVVLKEDYFKLIRQAGFNSVRIPIRWSAHCLKQKPYTIDPNFLHRVDWAVKNAIFYDLYTIINIHHYEEIFEDPNEHKERFLAIWQQIAEHFKDCPQTVLFEFLNEPCKNLDDDKWNNLVDKVLKAVRKTNPERTIIIGPTGWNSIDKLDKLLLPAEDRNIIVTCHYYQPFHFTHQGASWVGEESKQWLGTKWTGTEKEKQEIKKDFDSAFEWGKKHNRPIYIGEFGSYSKADIQSRVLWTGFIAREAEKRNFSWAYWEFCSYFGIYDSDAGKWRKELLEALIPNTKTGVK